MPARDNDTLRTAIIAVDVGGKHLSGELLTSDAICIAHCRIEDDSTIGEAAFNLLVDLLNDLLQIASNLQIEVTGFAVGIPGTVNHLTGEVDLCPNRGWKQFPLKARLHAHFAPQTSILVENDVNLALLGESAYGAGVGRNNIMMIAIGTGIGGAILINQKLVHGHHHAAGEVGLLLTTPLSLNHFWDDFGDLEHRASALGIENQAKKRYPDEAEHHTAKAIFKAAKNDEFWAVELVDQTLRYLAFALCNITCLLDPDLIIIGGGMAHSFDYIHPKLVSRISSAIPIVPEIRKAALGDRAVILGGLSQFLAQ